ELVLKAGPDGCYYRGADGRICHQPSLASHVVDPVGAGDAFGGAYLAARLRGATPAAAAWLGSITAAAIVASPGDTEGLPTPPAAADLVQTALAR
ncbi:MAG: PfkB family carbohydrate kinase, partial [Dehalococcoidia bacterium]